MLEQVAVGVSVHVSEFLQSNSVVVQGRDGVLLIDPGLRGEEISCLADDLRDLGQHVTVGFSTHPHWDHVLWHERFGSVPRLGTARCAADLRALLSDAGWRDRVAQVLPPDIADQIPMDLFGRIAGLPADARQIPWDGPRVRVIEHHAHAAGHAALFVEEAGVLVAGDMLSDTLIPFLDLDAADPISDYLAALQLFEDVAGDVDVVIPGHGSVGDEDQVRARIDLDRAYVHTVRSRGGSDDQRLDRSAPNGEWLPGVDARQRRQLAEPGDRARTSV